MKSGFLLIDKDEGLTSNDIDYKVKKIFKTKSVGHLGTLDPFATGLLIIGINKATKLFPILNEDKKTYIATATLFKETDTLDITGKLLNETIKKKITKEDIEEIFTSFLGKSYQTPPKYSAVHINGKRAYSLARENIDFILPKKEITVYSLNLLNFKEDEITFSCKVSKGCYIRQLSYDIFLKLGIISHLKALRRTDIGPYSVSKAKKITDIKEVDLLSCKDMLKDYKVININDDKTLKQVSNGNVLSLSYKDNFIFFRKNNEDLALYKKQDDNKYHLVTFLNF